MKPLSFMLIAGEASGDTLAAELVSALRAKVLEVESKPTSDVQPLRTELAPRFFGAGGSRMAAAGVEVVVDMTQHAVIGLSDVLKNYFKFRQLFRRLLELAIERQPDVIIGVDYGGFNLRFAHAVKQHVRRHRKEFVPWNPKIVQYVSPQVWASRPGRAQQMAEDHDLLLSIFPFEKSWYAGRVPQLRVAFVGNPMVERFEDRKSKKKDPLELVFQSSRVPGDTVLLLPGSRSSELRRHLPVMVEAARRIKAKHKTRFWMVLPNPELAALAQSLAQVKIFRELSEDSFDLDNHPSIRCFDCNTADILPQVDVAIASTGTVTVECAFFGVPAVTLYRLSWPEYQFAKRIVTVKSVTMPNILAGEEVFPEFIQHAATPENVSSAVLELLHDEKRRQGVKAKLSRVVASLGGPGANARAAEAIVRLLR